jgi:hypothetical protein
MRLQNCLIYVFLGLFVVSGALAQSPQTIVISEEGIVLLRNGQTLKGRITRTGDYYLVTRGVTSELRLLAISVEVVCADMQALYEHKLSHLEHGSRAGHLALARWCLQQDLTARAADQTLVAFALDPNGAGLDMIERQLLATERRADEATTKTSKVRVAPTLHEIEQRVDELPVGAVYQFVTTVQPLLINRCATNGCHGLRSESEFRLLRPNSHQSLSRRMTHRNLFATLGYVDREDPRQSKLLTVIRTPHGGGAAVFSEAETHQVQLLEKWLAVLAQRPTANLPASVAKPPEFLLQTRAEAIVEFLDGVSAAENSPAAIPPGEGQPGNLAEVYEPRDPFDPEIFNRRFRRNAKPAEK